MKQSSIKSDLLLAKQIKANHPDIALQYEDRIRQLPAIFEYYTLLPKLLTAFCQFHNIEENLLTGTRSGIEMNDLKKKFVGCMILSYHPDMITGHDEKIKDRLCKEISFLLGCKREQVSMYASVAISALNPDRKFSTAYQAFKIETYEVLEYLKEKFVQAETEPKEESLFTLIAS